MNRSALSLIGAATALAAVTGLAALTAPDASSGGPAVATERLPVERATLLCPQPPASDLAKTTYTSFTPAGESKGAAARRGSAELLPAAPAGDGGEGGSGRDGDASGGSREDGGTSGGEGERPEPVAPLVEPGRPATATTSDAAAPALIGSADGAVAPGWTAQQTTVVSAGSGRGVLGTACTAPGTEHWFPGASTAQGRRDYVHLTNPDTAATVVDLGLYGEDGPLEPTAGEGVTVGPRSSVRVLLSTLTAERADRATLRVVARAGRVGASVQALDARAGGDWLAAAAAPGSRAVLPGIPADATSVRLVAMATGEEDADLKVSLAGPTGSFTPAGHETLHVRSGMTTAVDLGNVTRGEAGSLVLTPAEDGGDGEFVAALQVTRGKGDRRETAFIPATEEVRGRATAADNRPEGTTLSLVAPRAAARVKVVATGRSGSPSVRTHTVKAGTTLRVPATGPARGKDGYALTVEHVSGGSLYAARTLEIPQGGLPAFTVQTLPDDRGTVAVPEAAQDLSLLTD